MRQYLFTLLLLLLFSNTILAQSPSDTTANEMPQVANYVQQLESVIQKNTDLKEKKTNLEQIEKEKRSRLQEVTRTQKEQKDEIQKTQSDIKKQNEKLAKSSYQELYNKKQALTDNIQEYQVKLKELNDQLVALNTQLAESNKMVDELEGIKKKVSSQLISDNKATLEQPFSKVTLDELNMVREKCLPYSSAQSVNDFIKRVDITIQNKILYEEINKTLNSPYQEAAVTEASEKIGKFLNLTDSQKEETQRLNKQLSSFKDGVNAFKEFINNLNKCRGKNYTWQYFEDDKQSIYPGNLEERINDSLMAVPYLKKRYEDFLRTFRKNPNKHSDIEKEILNQ